MVKILHYRALENFIEKSHVQLKKNEKFLLEKKINPENFEFRDFLFDIANLSNQNPGSIIFAIFTIFANEKPVNEPLNKLAFCLDDKNWNDGTIDFYFNKFINRAIKLKFCCQYYEDKNVCVSVNYFAKCKLYSLQEMCFYQALKFMPDSFLKKIPPVVQDSLKPFSYLWDRKYICKNYHDIDQCRFNSSDNCIAFGGY